MESGESGVQRGTMSKLEVVVVEDGFGDGAFQWTELGEKAGLEAIVVSSEETCSGSLATFCELPEGYNGFDSGFLSKLKKLRNENPGKFLGVVMRNAASLPLIRQKLTKAGVNMFTEDPEAVGKVLETLAIIDQDAAGENRCPFCMNSFGEKALAYHVALNHCLENPMALRNFRCDLCGMIESPDLLQKHFHKVHVMEKLKNENSSGSPPLLFAFALVVCRNAEGKFLLVHERDDRGFWLPGGGVKLPEDLIDAARRETMEEAGVKVEIKGVLQIQFGSGPKIARLRVIFYAEPIDDSCNNMPKTVPDYESGGATWCSPKDLPHLQLRGPEPNNWFNYVQDGGEIYGVDVLSKDEN